MSAPRIAPGGLREIGLPIWLFSRLAGRVTAHRPAARSSPRSAATAGCSGAGCTSPARLMPGGKLPRIDTELVILRVAARARQRLRVQPPQRARPTRRPRSTTTSSACALGPTPPAGTSDSRCCCASPTRCSSTATSTTTSGHELRAAERRAHLHRAAAARRPLRHARHDPGHPAGAAGGPPLMTIHHPAHPSGTFGMVSSTHWLASQSAQRMLELGGNAFDAAVAGGFVLHVVEPHLNGPGGDVPRSWPPPTTRRPRVLCGQGPAPGGCDPRGVRGAGSRPRARVRPARGGRARRRRRLAAPAARPRHAAAARPCSSRRSATRATGIRCSRGWPRRSTGCRTCSARLDDVGRAVAEAAGARAPAAVPQPGVRRDPRAARDARARPARRGRQAQAARRRVAARASSPRRSTRSSRSGGTRGEVRPGLIGGDDLAASGDLGGAGRRSTGTAYRSPRPGRGARDQRCCRRWRYWTSWAVALDPDSAEGVHTIAEVLKLVMADREAWYGDDPPCR